MAMLCTELHRFHLDTDLDIISYASTGFSCAQFCIAWMLFLAIKDSYRSVRYSFLTEKQPTVSSAGCQIAGVVIGALLYHLPFLPHVRVVAHQLHNMYDPCVAPAENQWKFVRIFEWPHDLYYVVYYCFVYFLVIYLFPCLAIASKCKHTADFLFNMNHQRHLPTETVNCSISAMMTLAIANVYLVLNTPKIVILLFRLFNYPFLFMLRSYGWFHLINLLANMLVVLRPSCTVIVMMVYNGRIRQTIVRYGCFGWKQIQRTRNSIRALSKYGRRLPRKTTSV